MNMPLDIAVDIGRIVREMQAWRMALDLFGLADDLLIRFPETGVPRGHVLAALKQEAGAAGVELS